MNIRDWPMDKIMQLPDCCFGRRWPILVALHNIASETSWDISELALPEVAIIYELAILATGEAGKFSTIRFALGDQLPTTTAMMDVLEPLFSGFGLQGAEPRFLQVQTQLAFVISRLRMPIYARGRRLILEHRTGIGAIVNCNVGVVVSSMPTEVPDWLLSDRV